MCLKSMPQSEVHRGLKAQIELSSLPGQNFSGSVAQETPMQSIQLRVPCGRKSMFPIARGALPARFAQVHFAVNVGTF